MLNRRLGRWCLVPVLLAAGGLAQAAGFAVEEAAARLVDGVYRLDARLRLDLGSEPRRALQSGVPLVVVLDIELTRPRRWMWDAVAARLTQRYRLRYHALTQQYVVENLNSGARHSHPGLEAALRAVGRLRGLPLIDRQLLEDGVAYRVRLRVHLDFQALPVPLWLTAYMTRSWWVGSDWYSFPLEGPRRG